VNTDINKQALKALDDLKGYASEWLGEDMANEISSVIRSGLTQPSVWQDITNAPKDGTVIDLWAAGEYGGRRTNCFFKDGLWQSERGIECFDFTHFMPVEPSAWQPIETAPRDGTEIDIYIPELEQRYPDAYWCSIENCWCWDLQGLEGKRINFTATPPTHWMPLPKPPVDVKRVDDV